MKISFTPQENVVMYQLLEYLQYACEEPELKRQFRITKKQFGLGNPVTKLNQERLGLVRAVVKKAIGSADADERKKFFNGVSSKIEEGLRKRRL